MIALLYLAFFASGASALLLESLWFRETGLLLGNSVWATSLVTSSFMGGLAVGSALAARRARRLKRPLVAYAVLEVAIATTGVALVFALPNLGSFFAPVFGRLGGHPAGLNALRLALAFGLLLIPATAMGATLPLLASALSARDANFGRVLGRLYGWNTLGGVLGALAGEAWLIERLGLRGAALAAGSLNLLAAWLALGVARGSAETKLTASDARGLVPSRGLVLAAFLCGAIALALEVLWFRLLLMFVYGTSLAFAVLLAVVLLGVAAGGLLAGSVLRRMPQTASLLPALALLGGTLTVWTYAASPHSLAPHAAAPIATMTQIALPALALMFPSCALSGLLFTFLGAALRSSGYQVAEASGTLAFANTLGAMLGAPLAGFFLLPYAGIEQGLFVLAALYSVVAALTFDRDALRDPARGSGRVGLAVSALAWAVTLALFPFGLMRSRHLPMALAAWTADGSRVVIEREGLTETIAYLRRSLFGATVSTRLVTNGFSMSSSQLSAERYMRLFVYLPVALRPEPKRALLISYGLGMTAKALADTRSLEAVDVVDTSKDILELGRVVFPDGGFPLDDPRFSVHVEDGRFFLLTTNESWDLITSEPPPPKNAGIVNLYTREHFALIRKRLAPGGVASYWLPVYQMEYDEARAVARAFCDAFEDCSLWTGYGLEWMLAGTAGASGPVDEAAFTRAWRDATVAPTLKALGLEVPERLGSAFLAGPEQLGKLIAGVMPVTDDHPLRISPRRPASIDPRYLELMDAGRARDAFEASAWIRKLWPEALRARTLAAFEAQADLNRAIGWRAAGREQSLKEIWELLAGPASRVVILIALRTNEREISAAKRAAARGEAGPLVDFLLAADALGDRDFARAAGALERAAADPQLAPRALPLRSLAAALAARQGMCAMKAGPRGGR